ncbi:MAG: GNAT family N-acetyltransferase [Pseudomonadota bacterium]
MTDYPITLHTTLDTDRTRALHDGLANAGQTLRASELADFLLTIDDPSGALIGGCKGDIAFRSAHVAELWVDAAHQGKGLGRALLARAEEHALAQNCIRVHLETRSEAARGLYEKLGYRVFGTLPDYNGSQAFYYLEKRLD